jgi:hypothetical protein
VPAAVVSWSGSLSWDSRVITGGQGPPLAANDGLGGAVEQWIVSSGSGSGSGGRGRGSGSGSGSGSVWEGARAGVTLAPSSGWSDRVTG